MSMHLIQLNWPGLRHFVGAAAGYLISRAVHRPFVGGRPTVVMIEPISHCNLRCPLCLTGERKLTRPMGRMTCAEFVRILDNIGPQVRVCAFWNQGEPTLNADLPEMVRSAARRGICTIVSTNGNLLLHHNMAERLVDAGLSELIVSVEGLDQDSYATYRVGGDLDCVIRGIRRVRDGRDAGGMTRPRIVLQWLPMRHNLHQSAQLREAARQWGADVVRVKSTHVFTPEQGLRFLPSISGLRRYHDDAAELRPRQRNRLCRQIWFQTTVNWNGTVVPCCFDRDEALPMGNALIEDFGDIWRGERYTRLRTTLMQDGRVPDICRNCAEALDNFNIPLTRLERLTQGAAKLPPLGADRNARAEGAAGSDAETTTPLRTTT
jgi:radical SAM protein with 4Fe4S-binding SPASM domain